MSSSSIPEKPILDQYEESDWKELPQWIREAASVLGYTKKLWDKDKEPSTCQKDWSNLSIPEQQAATRLGYNANLWDGDSSDSDSCSESDGDDDGEMLSPKTTTATTTGKKLYCIQLYTETHDYKLQIREGMGISMHANRSMGKDEIIMTSPTGPSNHQTLLQASSSSSSLLSPERTAFAQRFVEWQKLYGRMDRPGASGYKLSFTLDDFSYVPDHHRIEDHILPTESNPSYHMELYENDVVIVEFIPPNNNDSDSNSGDNTTSSSSSSSLPPERRFEILDFDEALVEDCEENYDPKIMKRPTSLCGCETRCLEVPGHFNNHACGSSATAYDTVRLADDCSSSCPLVAPAQPSWVQEELQSKCEFPDIPNMMTTHRALVPGDEITTNYILWHWSNDDYIPNSPVTVTPTDFFDEWEWEELPSKIVKAAKILGYTQTIWEEDREVDISAFEKDWKELTSKERDAAKVLGYTDNSWNETEEEEKEESPSPAVVSHHEDDMLIDDMDWGELTDEQRKAALALGYNEVNWDADDEEDIPLSDLYWCQLTPEQQTSAATIGYNQLNWDSSGAEEPWFYCRCGDDKCHSADGFRGLKYLPVEEQKRLYWVVEPYVQHQIAWKLYQLEQEKEGI